jgi:pimeloyl-ACP methyl ester carboxylesterase
VREEGVGRFGYKFDPGWFGLSSRPPPDLQRVGCPTLLVRGGESTLLTREAAAAFVEALTGARPPARWVEIPDAGHHVLVDQPERLRAVLEAFLASLPAPTPLVDARPIAT